jgi:hypothetical protein
MIDNSDRYASSDRFRRVIELKKFFSMLYFDISRGSLAECPYWTDNIFTPADCDFLYTESPVYRELLNKFEDSSKSELGECCVLLVMELFGTIEDFVNEVVADEN